MKFTQAQKDQGIALINAYDFGFLRERYIDECPEFTNQFDQAVQELKKFFSLMFYTEGPLAAMSHAVDELWHIFVLHTPQYSAFCEDVFSEYTHHQPRSTAIPVPFSAISTFYIEYPKQFGVVSPIWFEDIPVKHRNAVAVGQVPTAVQALKWSGWPGWSEAVEQFVNMYRSK